MSLTLGWLGYEEKIDDNSKKTAKQKANSGSNYC